MFNKKKIGKVKSHIAKKLKKKKELTSMDYIAHNIITQLYKNNFKSYLFNIIHFI